MLNIINEIDEKNYTLEFDNYKTIVNKKAFEEIHKNDIEIIFYYEE